MSLWGKNPDAIDNKPKWASTDENSPYNKADIYATNAGWVRKAGTAATGNGNVNADPEVLVALGGLAGVSASTGLQAPTITSFRFVTQSLVDGTGKTMTVEVTYDEAVTVDTTGGAPTLVIANGDESTDGDGDATLSYTGTGSTANRIRFTATGLTLSANDVYTIGGDNDITIPSGSSITDAADGSTAASVDMGVVTAVTKTVVAA